MKSKASTGTAREGREKQGGSAAVDAGIVSPTVVIVSGRSAL